MLFQQIPVARIIVYDPVHTSLGTGFNGGGHCIVTAEVSFVEGHDFSGKKDTDAKWQEIFVFIGICHFFCQNGGVLHLDSMDFGSEIPSDSKRRCSYYVNRHSFAQSPQKCLLHPVWYPFLPFPHINMGTLVIKVPNAIWSLFISYDISCLHKCQKYKENLYILYSVFQL